MPMTPIERVARAIGEQREALRAERNRSLNSQGLWADQQWQPSDTDLARAAIEAMREPSAEMVEAGRWPAEDDGPIACWSAMIDAALEEAQP